VVTGGLVDMGSPHGNVLSLSADASLATFNWDVSWALWPRSTNSAPYDPTRTFVNFDAFVSRLKPFWVRLGYNGSPYPDTRDLQIDVNPTVVGAFQSFSIPLSSFSVTWLTGNPAPLPTMIEFGIRGILTNSALSWGYDSNNVLMIDNLTYVVEPAPSPPPALSIAVSDNTVAISWPTNATPFVLQETAALDAPSWTVVTNLTVVTNGTNYVNVAPLLGQNFYRLTSP
jgi:hypothetical protein